MSFADRFELLELLREGGVETFRALDRTSGHTVEIHLSASSESLAQFESVIDRGSHEGKLYVVTTSSDLESAGAWRIPSPEKAPPPGEFTQMFQLRQSPEPAAEPAPKAVPAPAAQAGQFTQAFKRPTTTSAAVPSDADSPGQPGEFTSMFQKPVSPQTAPTIAPAAALQAAPQTMPATPDTSPSRPRTGLIVTVVLIISAIVVFILVRTLY